MLRRRVQAPGVQVYLRRIRVNRHRAATRVGSDVWNVATAWARLHGGKDGDGEQQSQGNGEADHDPPQPLPEEETSPLTVNLLSPTNMVVHRMSGKIRTVNLYLSIDEHERLRRIKERTGCTSWVDLLSRGADALAEQRK